jgi:2Fe-2S ferredoxin
MDPPSLVNVTYVDAQGALYEVQVPEGTTVMEAAITNEVPSIVGFCGGMCACGTCHCYPAAAWADRLPPKDDNEKDTLARVADRRAASRLGCQIRLDGTLNGLVVELPARQRSP